MLCCGYRVGGCGVARERKWKGKILTLPIYSDRRSWRAWRTELHSATMRSLRSSRVQEESAMRAAPLIMLSRRSSREGRKRSSLNASGSTMICFCKERGRGKITQGEKNAISHHGTLISPSSSLKREMCQASRGQIWQTDRPAGKPKGKNVLSCLFCVCRPLTWCTVSETVS